LILLDTVAFIRLAQGEPLSETALRAVAAADRAQAMLLSVVSIWELDTLARRTGKTGAVIGLDAKHWITTALSRIPAIVIAFDAEDAMALLDLPPMHADPADRMLVATARRRAIPLVTSDDKILDMAKRGQLAAIGC